MAEDPEKKFQSIMGKLFQSPPSSVGLRLSRGVKRPNQGNELALVDPKSRGSEEAQLSQPRSRSTLPSICRPWDRGDLMRRLSTFKSMTWFAKPKVVDAVNCARRGWINVDMDIIACEVCGARILFSTPSSWTREQVEKAALVFSLKLDNGHKLHCPWIDNACDESLARFPPTPVPVLVDGFKQRCSVLVQLRALPVISPAAVKLLRTPQLKQFLQSSLELETEDLSLQKPLVDGKTSPSNNSYNEVLKLISLCGWEPRALPYMVVGKNANVQSSAQSAPDKDPEIVMIDSSNIGQVSKKNGNSRSSSNSLSDPRSVVLDCKLCGASVGLWGFSTIFQPVEMFRMVGFTELDNRESPACGTGFTELDNRENPASGTLLDRSSRDDRNVVFGSSSSHPTSIESVSNLNLSIAGGPLPTKQNFKATISLPVIGRSIRARLSSDSSFRNCLGIDADSRFESATLSNEGTETTEYASGSLTENPPFLSNPVDPSVCDDANCILIEDTENSGSGKFVGQSSNESIEILGVRPNDLVNERADDLVAVSFDDNSQNDTMDVSDPHKEKGSSEIVPVNNQKGLSAVEEVSISSNSNRESGGGNCSKNKESSALQKEAFEDERPDYRKQLSVEYDLPPGSNSGVMLEECVMLFDPVRQHRPFCPWIVSADNGIPGWQQTLSALIYHEGLDSKLMKSPSTPIVKVDDPLTSVRRLFTSKRRKSTLGSS